MKLKRVLLIVLAGVQALLFCIVVCVFNHVLKSSMDPTHPVTYYIDIIAYVNSMTGFLTTIFSLAVVDFVFCIGEKRYNRSMLGIVITIIAFGITKTVLSLSFVGLGTAFFYRIVMSDPYTGFAYYLAWIVLTSAPYLGLAIAYIVVKARYLKTTSAKSANL